MPVYTIEKIRTKDGNYHERHHRRKGHRVMIDHIALENPLIIKYIDDGDKCLMTSKVEVYSGEGLKDETLVVQTHNSIYVFKKEDE